MAHPCVFISAGDPSGDNAAAKVVSFLLEKNPELKLLGLGGTALKTLGQDQFVDGSELAVLGFWEVAKRYLFFRRLFKKSVAKIKQEQPSLILLVDYPGFNLRLAKKIKPLGIPVVYYISPQVWAWGQKRLQQIKELVDLMILILPFEQKFFADSGVNSRFVGHYLLEDIPSEYIKTSSTINGQSATLALLPGSRAQEVERMLPCMMKAAVTFNKRHGTRTEIAAISGIYDYQNCFDRFGDESISIVYDNPRRVIHNSSLVVTASGTATLETAIIGRPMVVVYRTGSVTYQIARRLVKLDKIALANLVLGEKVLPELIQGEATPESIVAELEKLWNDEIYYGQVQEKLHTVPDLLGGKGASRRTADLIGEYL